MTKTFKIGRREFGVAALVSAVAAPAIIIPTLSRRSRAHTEHTSEADLEIFSGEFYFRTEDGGENEPVRFQTGEPHLLRFFNEGSTDHEIHFGRDADLEGRFYRENLFNPNPPGGPAGPHTAHGFLGLHLDAWVDRDLPMPTATLHVWVPAGKEGEWEIGCLIPGHYEAGQKAPIILTRDEA